ncbi:ABC transporter permease [TM7 phylum sp. oral taxon 346]|nr:ABC transporter permease [TM7 phylum sp. oral taxon 356]TWP27027.1 ABC transporter permease [TM7 phylum sp. oral taxon 346]
MTIIKRAWTAVARKRRRSLTIALIMTLIFTLLIGTLTVQQTMAQLKQSVERNIRAGFSVASKQPSGEVPMETARQVQRLDKVKAHNFQSETTAGLPGKQLIDTAGSGVQLDSNVDGEAKVTGATQSDLLSEFTGRFYQLEQGKHLTEHDQNAALIHKTFAEKNNIKPGDKLDITKDGRRVTVTVTGIFSGKGEKPAVLQSDMAENHLITNLAAAQQLTGSQQLTRATYFAENPHQLKSLTDRTKSLPNVDWQKFSLTDNGAAFAGVLQNIAGIQNILTIATIGAAAAGLAVLSLVLVFWVRGRLHEIGILLSIGTSKRQIIGQFLAELAIIAAVSSVFALGIGSVTSSQISTALTAQTDQSQRIEKTVVHAAPVATYLQAFAFGYMVVLLSAIAATAPIMRQSPKQILAKLS